MNWRIKNIPAWARGQGGPVTVSEIAAELGIGHAQALKLAIRLVDAGELIDNGDGTLSPRPDRRKEPEGPPPVQERLWRAMNFAKQPWTRRTVAQAAEADLGYAGAYLRFCQRRGFIIALPWQKGKAKTYRLHPDAPALGNPPVWKSRRSK